MSLVENLREMMLTPALSGHEGRMIRLMEKKLSPWGEAFTDRLGNVIVHIGGTDPQAPRVMLFAHTDQLGMVVRKIEADGFIAMERLGGVPEKVLPGCRMLVEGENGQLFPGIVGLKSHHATPQDEKGKVVPYTQLYLDLGLKSAEETRSKSIEVGCPIVYEPRFELMGDRVVGPSVDNRGGCAVLAEVAERMGQSRPACDLYIVATVLEEFNLRGAMVAAQQIKPDIAVALDIMIAGDTPDLRGHSDIRLGGGPILGMYSFHGRGTLNGVLPHPALVKSFRETAAKRGIPLQRNAAVGLLTDLSYVQLVGEQGVASVDLGFPARYTHSPVEMCDLADLTALSDLLEAAIRSWGPMDLRR